MGYSVLVQTAATVISWGPAGKHATPCRALAHTEHVTCQPPCLYPAHAADLLCWGHLRTPW